MDDRSDVPTMTTDVDKGRLRFMLIYYAFHDLRTTSESVLSIGGPVNDALDHGLSRQHPSPSR